MSQVRVRKTRVSRQRELIEELERAFLAVREMARGLPHGPERWRESVILRESENALARIRAEARG